MTNIMNNTCGFHRRYIGDKALYIGNKRFCKSLVKKNLICRTEDIFYYDTATFLWTVSVNLKILTKTEVSSQN